MTSERFSPYPFTPTHTECVSDYEPVELNGAMYLVEASVIPRATSPCGQNAKLFRWNGSGWAEQTDIPPILVKDSWKVKAMNLGGTVHLVFSPAAQHGDKMTLWRFNGRAFELVQEFPEIKRKQYLYWSVTHIDNEVYFVVGIWPLVMRRRLSLLEEEPFDAAAGTRNHSGASLLPRGLNGNTPQPTFNVVVFRYTGTAFEVYQTWGNNPGCGKLQGVTCKPGCSGIITTIIDGKHYLLEQHVTGGLWLHRWNGNFFEVYQHISARNNAASALFTVSDSLLDPADPQFGKGDSLMLSSRYSGFRAAENLIWRWNATHFHPSAHFTAPPEKTAIPSPTWSVFKIDRRTFLVSTSGTIFVPSPVTTTTSTSTTTWDISYRENPSELKQSKPVAHLKVTSTARKKQSMTLVNAVAAAIVLALRAVT